ncbi:putative disease resistance protein At1g61300 [Tasmannia lanceolata]|uniref:putative disease resistance protein At1g61300 n=1 Tax=Tasmannia lanceolata TaxID=3420 RepID=UPI0040636416
MSSETSDFVFRHVHSFNRYIFGHKLPNLKVLSLRSSGIRELPPGLIGFGTVNILDLSNTISLQKVSGYLENIHALQELYMINSFSGWEFPFLLFMFSKLTRLYHIENVEYLSHEFSSSLTEINLIEFCITVGSPAYFDSTYQTNMQITTSKPISTWVKELMQRTENLSLFSCHLDHMCNIRGIVGDSLLIFQNLRKLRVQLCHGFKDLFSITLAAQGLQQLEILEIIDCHGMKQIVAMAEGEEQVVDKKGWFPNLMYLSIENMLNLTSFCQDGVLLDWPSLICITIKLCLRLKRLPLGIQSALKLDMIGGENE